ncbi:hypothetical protein OTERR_20210 [Oryzomicrobium terrae]|uniref:Autotransporter domain-containing protein n=1 Tax=Oryzomicrobium terrae TaxID=1735038 RepID=A0A5C1EBC9_9RHOO|nr:autotransporter domain-containing protein [Oryzomicrobium terrae]QEL65497.1 hypothetical protein OTERR_20210 [Oryzomicrobium terrae]
MNKIYRLVRNHKLGRLQPVPETATCREGLTSGNTTVAAGKSPLLLSPLPLTALALVSWLPAAHADSVLWNGTTTTWGTNGNWVWNGHAPTGSDTAVINTDSTLSPLIASGTSGNVGTLVVGGGAAGRLQIQGTLNSTTGLIGNDNNTTSTTGTVTVSGATGNWSNSGDLYIGNYSTGSLNVSSGARTSASELYVGGASTANGTVDLQNSDSTLTVSSRAFIGHAGTGTLNLATGTSMSSTYAVLGEQAGSRGTANVQGGWNVGSGQMLVGNDGQGILSITNGGTVSNGVGSIGAGANGLTSTALVSGVGSMWSNSDRLFVGIRGQGQLDITQGGQVSSADGVLARYAGAFGTATVDGSGSRWTMAGDLRVGGDTTDPATPGGTGTLTIRNGGAVSSNAGYLGDAANATGTVTINNASWVLTGRLGIGNYGTGSLTIENGGTVTSSGGLIGWNASSSSNQVTVTGGTSRWTMTGHLFVGNEGQGNLSIQNGGQVSSVDGYVGSESNPLQSSVSLSGSGSWWTTTGDLFVAHNNGAKGLLTIAGGASVVTGLQAILGDLAGSNGTANLSGTGTTWSVGNEVNVGRFGAAILTITDGATLTSNKGYLGNEAGSSGAVTISGSNSLWNSTGKLYVGNSGSGTLTLVNGGRVQATALVIANTASASGTLNIGAAEGQAAAAPGTISAGSITLGAGNGTLVFNHTASSYLLAPTLAGNGTIKVLAGTTTFQGNNSFTGTAGIASGATLNLSTGATFGGTLNVAQGGTLNAVSNTVGTINNNGTLGLQSFNTVYPTITITGNFAQGSTGTLLIGAKSAAAGDYTRLNVAGQASLGGTLSVDVANGSPLAPGQRLVRVIDAGGGIQTRFASITDNSALFDFSPVYSATTLDLLLVAAGSSGVSTAVQSTGNTPGTGAAAVLDQVIATDPSSPLATLFVPLTNKAQISSAVSQTLPLLTGGSTLAAQGFLGGINQMIHSRMASQRGLASGDGFLGDQRLWMKPFASLANQADSNGAAGFRTRIGGVAFGSDAQLSDRARTGLAFAYAGANVDGNSSAAPNNAQVQLYQLIGYGSYQLDSGADLGWQVDVGNNHNQGRRHILFAGTTAQSSFDTLSAHAGLRLSNTWPLAANTSVTPSFGLDYTWLRDAGYTETGAGALNLKVNSRSAEQLLLSSDIRVGHRLDNGLTLAGNVGVAYDTTARQSAITAAYAGAPGAAFITRGINPDPWVVRGGLGVAKSTASGLEIQGRIDAEHRQGFNNRTASVNFRWAF